MSTIKFEKGKFYRTRSGKKMECVYANLIGNEPLLFVVEGSNDYFTTFPDGMYYGCGQENPYDIIYEWKDERVVWVVYNGRSGYTFSSPLYSEAFRWYTNLDEHPANSITRLVIQDGHVDTE